MMIEVMRPEDVSQVAELEAEIFTRPWSQQGFLDSLALEDNIFLVAKEQEKILGYCGMCCALDEGEITNVAVAPGSRGLGLGRTLMEQLLQRSGNKGIHLVILEVRESNSTAIHLYETLGFSIQGRRKNFYELPREDAYVMVRNQ